MKKSRKLIILFIIMFVTVGLLNVSKVYADPNSSKGFAEYDDAQAEQESQKMLEEQQKELQEAEGKSTNNYLESLKVEGYELSPDFDKQTIEYKIKGNVTSNEINIIATPSDSKAKVQGAGKVKVEGNSFRIDVIAETGTVRTYIIYLTDKTDNNEQITQEEKEEQKQLEENQIEQPTEETSSIIQENSEIKNNNIGNNETFFNSSTILVIIFVIIVIAIIGVLIVRNKNSKGKHC